LYATPEWAKEAKAMYKHDAEVIEDLSLKAMHRQTEGVDYCSMASEHNNRTKLLIHFRNIEHTNFMDQPEVKARRMAFFAKANEAAIKDNQAGTDNPDLVADVDEEMEENEDTTTQTSTAGQPT
jgi:hypothetical protein